MLFIIKGMERLKQYANRIVGSIAKYTFSDIVANSQSMRQAERLARMAAGNDMTILLCGESGTGKELFAHAIHSAGHRANGPFVVVNCGAIPRELVESELFGYEGGSFTGGDRKGRPGKFELADKGTLFLDEIGDMPLVAQTSFLRFLQEKEVTRVGGRHSHRLNVRIIAATHRNLEEMVHKNTFRLDLFYRLNAMSIKIPPLRERSADIMFIAKKFLGILSQGKKTMDFSPEVEQVFTNYSWPGNIRELENCVEFAFNISGDKDIITVDNLPASLQNNNSVYLDASQDKLFLSKQQLISETLRKNNYNIQKTAREINCARSTIYRYIKKKASEM